MSVCIALIDPPDFFTNLDVVWGKVTLGTSRPEQISAVVVKLEGESKTALAWPEVTDIRLGNGNGRHASGSDKSQTVLEKRKILYIVQQLFPAPGSSDPTSPVVVGPGRHEWHFHFGIPFNNSCAAANAMFRIGGMAAAAGFSGSSSFRRGGIRLMEGSKQLPYPPVTRALPPSFTGFPGQAEIRYYVKVTIRRPGLFKENFRHQVGFKFMPMEPPRPPPSRQEQYARRTFTFTARSSAINGTAQPPLSKPKPPIVFSRGLSSDSSTANGPSSSDHEQPPCIEICARLPHPPILTCNKPIPLRILAKKLVAVRAECLLVSLQVDLIGSTLVRCQDRVKTKTSRWAVVTRQGLAVPLQTSSGGVVDDEVEIDSTLWSDRPLPNTVMPSFITWNLERSYSIEIKLGVSWRKPTERAIAQTLVLPLHFSQVQVYSGLEPPSCLFQAAFTRSQQSRQRPLPRPSRSAPSLPPRKERSDDPLYPPQLRPGQTASQAQTAQTATALASTGVNHTAGDGFKEAPPAYEEAPPSYDDAMADPMVEPVVPNGRARPAGSGVANENSPDTSPGNSP